MQFNIYSKEEFSSREKLVYCNAIEKLANYMHDQNISNIVFIDRAARLAYIGLLKFWKINYPEKEKPNIFFLNPEGIGESGFLRNFINKRKRKFDKAFKNSKLSTVKEEKVLVFDTCIHSWDTMKKITDFLWANWFMNLFIGAGHSTHNRDKVIPNFLIAEEENINCYPFGDRYCSNILTTTTDSIFSTFTSEKNNIEYAYKVRKEMKETITKYSNLSETKKEQYLLQAQEADPIKNILMRLLKSIVIITVLVYN